MTRQLVVRYGDYEVGGTNPNARPDDRYSFGRTRDGGFFEFTFVVSAGDSSTFGRICRAVEEAFRDPYRDLSIGFTSGGIYRGEQDDNTYLDPIPSIEKIGNEADSALSRRYRARIDYGLPANLNPTPGFRDVNVDVVVSASGRRTVVITGETTALGTKDAREMYDDGIDALASSVFSRLGIANIELIATDASVETINVKSLRFERTYQEILFSQGGATPDHPGIIDQQLDIDRLTEHPGDSDETPFGGGRFKQQARRAGRIRLTYTANIDRSYDPAAVYTSIRGWMINQMRVTFASANLALIGEDPQINRDDNTLAVRMEALAPVGTASPMERSVVATAIDTKIDIVRYAHDETRFGAYRYERKGEYMRMTVERTLWAKKVQLSEVMNRANQLVLAMASKTSHDGEQGYMTYPNVRYDVRPTIFGRAPQFTGTAVTITVSQIFVAFPKKKEGGSGGDRGRSTTPPERPRAGVTSNVP